MVRAIISLHNHTEASPDSDSRLEDILLICKKRGITHLVITDHDTILDPMSIPKKTYGIKIISGIESTAYDGSHIIGIFIKKPIENGLSAEKIMKNIKAQGGIVLLPHPFRPGQEGFSVKKEDIIEKHMQYVDCIEIFNDSSKPSENKKAEELCKRYKKRAVGGSDAHTPDAVCFVTMVYDVPEGKDLRWALTDQDGIIKKHLPNVVRKKMRACIRKVARTIANLIGIRKGSKTYKNARDKLLKHMKVRIK